MINSLKKLRRRYSEFGGLRLIKQYTRMGVLSTSIKAAIVGVYTGDWNRVYGYLISKVNLVLLDQYTPLIHKLKEKYDNANLNHDNSNKIWFCWLQGYENWPEIAKCSYNSICQFAKGREIIVVCYNNIDHFISLPPYIWELHKKGVIPKHSFAVLVRLELLIKYGGTWIDSTCLCTSNLPSEIMDCELFMFQKVENGQKELLGISNWFITSCSNNKTLLILRDILYQYWKDYDCLVNNYIFHFFFKIIANEYPELIKGMPVRNRVDALKLIAHLGDNYDEESFCNDIANSPVHKLSFRIKKEIKDNPFSIYNYIIRNYNVNKTF